MKFVQHKQFVNRSEFQVNEFLRSIPAEDIVQVSFHVHVNGNSADEWVSIFYKEEDREEQDCPACGGSGFSGIVALFGNGYDAVCDHCGGYRKIPRQDGGENL
ncbi:hypothetical protein [Paenibacillus ehimensis]|uniref:Uncharacterized protein n=1 Tax=Paenibacillus ehimensis TaxID=79264 RepID=A0ABT8VHF5_9BACL|nr:hypothetical protein [Paenibacillus ehimensis]MDO3680412.1 hypothetical protein [Paenibacillus ehimensis]